MRKVQSIPKAFHAKKQNILDSLGGPAELYTDLSPKGTVDEAIKPLIAQINGLDGAVTTSSCAGRISIFAEGRKDGGEHESAGASAPGGKGNGGRWLFVSHEPAHDVLDVYSKLKSTSPGSPRLSPRLVRFQFEPMILHIMCASLAHAAPLLSAAISAGFRESGIQSLKNLDDPGAFPMLAVRTAGLALESVIGLLDDSNPTLEDDDEGCCVYPLITEAARQILLDIANERFECNSDRMTRFEAEIRTQIQKEEENSQWEDKDVRAKRKRAKGMAENGSNQSIYKNVMNIVDEDDLGIGMMM